MFYTLADLRSSVDELISQQGPNAFCAAFVYTKEDVVDYYDELGKEPDEETTMDILSDLGDSNWIYEQIGDQLEDCVKERLNRI